jgi:hypothetical protein
MPTLDVSDAFDASFMDDIVVLRRSVSITSKGRTQVTEVPMSASAVVTAASPDDLARLPDSEYMNKAVSIYSQFRLRGPSRDEAGNETMPDEILWHGSRYVVRALDDFSGYGHGFVSAVAVSVDSVDPAPIPDPQGSA